MARRARSSDGRLSKQGDCANCHQVEVKVAWNAERNRWLCYGCWPLPTAREGKSEESQAYDSYFDDLVAKNATSSTFRDTIYGARIEDSRTRVGDFAVRCQCRGLLGDGLTIASARRLLQEHRH
jgi:hypothetical protein